MHQMIEVLEILLSLWVNMDVGQILKDIRNSSLHFVAI